MSRFTVVFFVLLAMLIPDPNPSIDHTLYLPVSYKDCNLDKAGGAIAYSLTGTAFNELCFTFWHDYNLLPRPNRYPLSTQYFVYWCDEWQGVSYRDMMINNLGQTNVVVIFVNELFYPDQCDMTEEEYVSEFTWLRTYCPDCLIVIGNTSWLDATQGYPVLKLQKQLIEGAGFDWGTDIQGIGIHDYSSDPTLSVNALELLMAEWGISHPIYITEFSANAMNIGEFVGYYESNPGIVSYLYFSPCNDIEELTLVHRELDENGRPICNQSELTKLGNLFANSAQVEPYP